MLYGTDDGWLWEKLNINEGSVTVWLRKIFFPRFCILWYIIIMLYVHVSVFFYKTSFTPVGCTVFKLSKNPHFRWCPTIMVFIITADSNSIIFLSSDSGVNISRMGNVCLWLLLNLTLRLCMPLSASLSDCLNTNVTKVTIIYLLSAWDRNHNHQHTQTHLFTSTCSVIDTSKTLVLFFFSFQLFVNLFYVWVCLLLFSLHRLSLSLFYTTSSSFLLFKQSLCQLC